VERADDVGRVVEGGVVDHDPIGPGPRGGRARPRADDDRATELDGTRDHHGPQATHPL
jgi:hypothetical protein